MATKAAKRGTRKVTTKKAGRKSPIAGARGKAGAGSKDG